MSNLIYTLPTDRLVPSAVTVQTGTEDPNYLAVNLVDLDPGNPAKLTGTTGAWVFDFGSAVTPQLFALIHHNLDAGISVRLQAHTSNTWGAPSLDLALTIPTYHEDGFPVNPWLDLSGATYTYRYWRLHIAGTNLSAIAVGEALFYLTKRSLAVNISWGAKRGEKHPIIEHETELGDSLIYELQTKQRSIQGELDTTDAGLTAMLSLMRAARGRSRAFVVIVDGSNDALFGRWLTPTFEYTEAFLDRHTVPFNFEESSRGTVL